jgi:ParB family chromosome partitioning protein
MGTIKGASKTAIFFFEANDSRLKVITDKQHVLYDRRVELPLEDSLVESIADIGVLHPIEVRKVGDNYEVIDGRRRVLHAREAQRRYPDRKIAIPVRPVTRRDSEAARDATVSNAQRRDSSPVTRGEEAIRLMESFGWGQDDVCRFFGAGWPAIQSWIKVAQDASDCVKEALENDQITLTKAIRISRHKTELQGEQLEKALEVGRQKPGPKPGPRKRRITIVATRDPESDVEDMYVTVPKCTAEELRHIIVRLERRIKSMECPV